jgi:uncharacterized protein YfiM (DUF2279 family)
MNGEIKFNKRRTIYLAIPVLVCLIALLLCACTSTGKNETTTINNVTDQVAKKDNSDAGKTGDDQEIVCRIRAATGTHFKNKICATKAAWAIRDRKKGEEIDEFNRDFGNRSSINSGNGLGDMSGGMPR